MKRALAWAAALLAACGGCGWSLPATVGLSQTADYANPKDRVVAEDGTEREVALDKLGFEEMALLGQSYRADPGRIARADLSDDGTEVYWLLPRGVSIKRSIFYGATDLSLPVCPVAAGGDTECSVRMSKGKWRLFLWDDTEAQTSFDLVVNDEPMRVVVDRPNNVMAGVLIAAITAGDLLVLGALLVTLDSMGAIWLDQPLIMGGVTLGGLGLMSAGGLGLSYGDLLGLYGRMEVLPKE